ncbi:MAG: phage tail tube protein [Halorhodospira sp.]
MTKLLRRRFTDVVLEETYGEDPGSDRIALLPTSDLSLEVQGEQQTRDTIRPSMSPRGHVVTDRSVSLTVPLELRGAGVDDDSKLRKPELDPLLRASMMKREDGARIVVTGTSGDFERGETVTNTTDSETVGTVADWDSDNRVLYIRDLDAMPDSGDELEGEDSSAAADVDEATEAYVYRPASLSPTDQPSLFMRYDLDGLLHKVPGCRGTFSINMSRSEIPSISFTLTGLYEKPSDDGALSGTPLDLVPAPVLDAELTLGDTDTSKIPITSVQADISNSVNARPDIQAPDGYHSHIITERDPTGSIDPEVVKLSDFDPYKDWSEANRVAIAAGIGSKAGHRVRVVMPQTQYTELPYSSRNGIATYDLGFRCVGEDDEFMLIYS